jgi:hypothetical protein
MEKKEKRQYVKPQVKSQKIEIGVYGCYDTDTRSTLPIKDKNLGGGTNLSG